MQPSLANWHANGQFHFDSEEADAVDVQVTWDEDAIVIDSPVSGSVWKMEVSEGQTVQAGQVLAILESMKMEIPIYATEKGVVTDLLLTEGSRVSAGQAVVVLK
ncbi:acetyl-CoA carboxylase biotin carboxyl carrier protein subunit [Marinomonas sp. GJ51-6]|uniref:acetyl-CoA carboxylase biotin carboxyl carrier protein subunit n=1 Tax=Marinomonas sp. GJ51-6 TaxID=2992802 RepID=UPI0029348C78|nr:biotin/lipoyl-containing protein [Marinomonas sp. GJ51-6]WOD08377.1 biotin/lipoyl-containing protein [Marinomonas sp. GJ51-6]